jgi:hypothetical protein
MARDLPSRESALRHRIGKKQTNYYYDQKQSSQSKEFSKTMANFNMHATGLNLNGQRLQLNANAHQASQGLLQKEYDPQMAGQP